MKFKKMVFCIQFCLFIFLELVFVPKIYPAFLDFSVPAREAALGGNGVAVPEGTSSLTFNPAGLGQESQFEVSARYEDLFPGLSDDNLSTGNLSAVLPLGGESEDAFGLSLDHFGSDNLEQDRIEAAFGKSFDEKSFFSGLRIGIDVSYLLQEFTLTAPIAGLNTASLSASAFSVGAGVLYDPFPFVTLGVSVEDLNQPNLGVIGIDTIPTLWRYGIAVHPAMEQDSLVITLCQDLSGTDLETQGGVEWTFNPLGVALRAGGDPNMGVVGLGWKSKGLFIDYAYQFSWNNAPSVNGIGLPGSHLLEIGFSWENVSAEQKIFDSMMIEGQKASQNKQWKQAFWIFQRALLLKPQDQAALQGRATALIEYNRIRGEAYFQAGQEAEAKGSFSDAQQDYKWASTVFPKEDRYSQALERVKKTLTEGALSDPQVQKLLEKSLEFQKNGKNQDALQSVRDAQKLYPDDLFINLLLINLTKQPIAPIKQAHKSVDSLTVEAELYRRKGQVDQARATWYKILSIDPNNPQAKENLAETQNSTSGKSVSAADKSAASALLEKGLKAYVNGDTTEAIRDWEEVLKIDPNNVNALNNLTRVRMEEGNGNK